MKNVSDRQQTEQRSTNRQRSPIVIISPQNRNNKNENNREKNQSLLHNFDVIFPNVVFKWPKKQNSSTIIAILITTSCSFVKIVLFWQYMICQL